MILISFIHINDTEQKLTHRYRINCYKKYRFCLYSGNIRITIYTKDTVTKLHMIFLTVSMKIHEMEQELCLKDCFKYKFIKHSYFDELFCLHLIAF